METLSMHVLPAVSPPQRLRRLAGGLLCALVTLLPLQSVRAECTASSSKNTVALVELYTSEGCSSCPPADRWLSRLPESFSSTRVVPLALHVDYWDYIGWKDRFAQAGFSSRQRQQARLGGSSFVYTPQIMLNGRDYATWGDRTRFNAAILNHNDKIAAADIRLSLSGVRAGELEVSASAQAAATHHPRLFVVLYENGLGSQVKAGENSGATLRHDFVVRSWSDAQAVGAQFTTPYRQRLQLPADGNPRNMGVAAFVQDARSGEVLQAMSMPLCP